MLRSKSLSITSRLLRVCMENRTLEVAVTSCRFSWGQMDWQRHLAASLPVAGGLADPRLLTLSPQVVICGQPDSEDTASLVSCVNALFLPHKVSGYSPRSACFVCAREAPGIAHERPDLWPVTPPEVALGGGGGFDISLAGRGKRGSCSQWG